MKEELLPKYPNVDDIVPINHAYGCGVAINAPEAKVPIRALRNLAKHPNFGGQLMVVGLGCEKFTVDMLLDQADISPENVIILQELKGFDAMVDALMKMADKKLAILNQRKRVTLPLSKLCIGMQCGGSDAFSGVTANPSAGYAADMLVKGGATVLFSEVTEVRDGVHYLAERCISPEVRDNWRQKCAGMIITLQKERWTEAPTRHREIKREVSAILWKRQWGPLQNQEPLLL